MLIPRFSLPRFASLLAGAALLLATALPGRAQNLWDDRTATITSGNNSNAGVIHNGSRFILTTGSSGGTYWKSAAGTSDWSFASLPSLPTNYFPSGIAFGNGATVVSGVRNTLHVTTAADPAGADWTRLNPIDLVPRGNPTGNGIPTLYRPRFLNGQFLVGSPFYNNTTTPANSYSEFLTSPDGVTWTSRKFTLAALTNIFHLRDVAFKPGATAGSGTYVFTTGQDTVLVAPESLASATRVTAGDLGSGQTITYGAGVFVIVTSTGKIFTSPTAATASWTERSLPLGVATSEFRDVFFDGTTFVAVGATVTGSSPSRPTILRSTDGIIWTEAATVPATAQTLFFAYKGDGLWLTGGGGRTLFTSGMSSVAAPSFTVQPQPFFGTVGGTITLTATVAGGPAPTVQWYKGEAALADDTRISGSATATLTITGATFADAGAYKLKATNTVGVKDSSSALVTLSASAGGAVFAPFGIEGTDSGGLIPGTTPARAVVRSGGPALFTVGAGLVPLSGTNVGGVNYSIAIAASPSGNLVLINAATGAHPPAVYNVTTSQIAALPALPLPLGTISSANSIGGGAIADNGDITGSINDQGSNLHAFHYNATTQTYTLLGNVPNATNDRATTAGGISADGSTVSGYERISFFNGPFLWNTTSGFTLLPDPANGGFANGDIRALSPNARFAVGYGLAPASIGSGSTAFRWDRGAALGAPLGTALARATGATFADARTVTDDGTVGGNVRVSGVERAAVWLPDGTLVMLADYLAETYGLTLTGFTLHQVVAISADGRTLSGDATNNTGASQGWLLTLPAPIEVTAVEPTAQSITFEPLDDRAAGASFDLSATATPSGLPVSFSLSSEPADIATLSGTTVTLGNTAGTVTITAAQAGGTVGDVTYAAAEPVERSFNVTVGPATQKQTITFAKPAALIYGGEPVALDATASSDLPITFELVSTVPATGVATLDDGTLTILGAGKVTLRANQPGAFPFKPAAPVTHTITVNKADLAVSFEAATRLVGQPNPAFVPTYAGFVNGDTAADLAPTRPAGATTAKPSSAAGAYPINLKGGLDANYRYVAGDPAFLTVQGFGGAYEALLVDDLGTPRGKLEILVPNNALTYTGTLNLASEPASIGLRGSLSATNGDSATGTWTRVADPTKAITALSLGFEIVGDTIDGELSGDSGLALKIDSGLRVFVQPIVAGKKQNAPWTGAHTLVLRDPAHIGEMDTRALPLGSGHASATIAATGVLTLKSKLADGTALTGSAKADTTGRFRVYVRPYAKRLHSFLSGELALEEHPDQTRFPTRYSVSEEDGRLFWAKAALPEATLEKNKDKSYRAGFEAELVTSLDPWLAPSAKPTVLNGVTVPAGTLAQRLAINAVSVDFTLAEGLDLGARAGFLPTTLNLSAAGAFSVPLPLPATADNPTFTLKVTPATGAFTGSFTLSDTPEGALKPVPRKVTVSGTLRQAPNGSDDSVGHAHFLFDPSVNDTSIEQVSGELRLRSPAD